MVKNRISSAAMAALLAGAASAASAADMIEPPVVELPEIPVVETVNAGGWYIRGDATYSVFDDVQSDYVVRGANVGLFGGAMSTNSLKGSLSNAYGFGGGIGYDTGGLLRFDVTADYFTKNDYTGSTTGTCGSLAGGVCTTTDTASLHAMSLLANAYVNLGKWHGITPYVGAGIGGTHVKWGSLSNDFNAPATEATEIHSGASSWRFTYAAMAGASYDINDCLAIDAGYRYRKIEGGKMFGFNGAATTGPGHDKGITAHDFRIGARYKFGGGGGRGCGGGHAPAPELVEYKPIFK